MPVNTLLKKNNLDNAEVHLLAGDASFRKYYRVTKRNSTVKTFVMMDAPPEKEDIQPFLHIAAHLYNQKLSSPKIIDYDLDNGLILMEDLCDDLYNRVITKENEETLYTHAIDVLLHLLESFEKNKQEKDFTRIPHYSDDLFLGELSLFTDWYLDTITQSQKEEFLGLWKDLLPQARHVPECLVLRDYHADNLIWLEGREGVQKVGLLDFQDAAIGPVTYDIISLLEDARRDVSSELTNKMISYYLSKSNIDNEAFMTSYAIMAAQRNIKIIGIFNRLAKRDHKPQYLEYVPRVIEYLRNDLEHPVLKDVKAWVESLPLTPCVF